MARHLLRWTVALLPVAVAAGLWTAIRGGLVADRRLAVEATALRSDWLLAAGCLVSLLGGLAVVLVGVRDARWRRRLDEQTTAGALDRRLLLSRLDHELKNPLTAMRAALANVSATATGSDQDAGLRSIEAQVLRLSRLTADLRKIADVESSEVDRRPVDVTALLEEAMEIVREQPAAAERALSLDLPRAPWPLPQLRGDWELLSLALLNLVDNALKYTAPGDRIEVRARETAGSVVVEVADTGPGIPPEDLPHIWEELYRSTRARGVAGSGLGLALVRAVVEQHGGTVAAESRVGRGTVVRVQLPSGVAGEA
ncbi:MAG: sensor histidine kinase [Blastococcus sp.]|nr:sensor histidine kinase [Blastococcus sp.]